ncbi:MAG: hypothetical protein L3J75_00295 [Methylococcaceae bacterium]|nr:hypothetical protein [Methylococcaceae bacterium]
MATLSSLAILAHSVMSGKECTEDFDGFGKTDILLNSMEGNGPVFALLMSKNSDY